MNLIIRNGKVDRFATEEEFYDLQATVVEDLTRISLYLLECDGNYSDLSSLLKKTKKLITSRNNPRYYSMEIALVDDYVAFTLPEKNILTDEKSTDPEIVILKCNMGGIYFLRELERKYVYSEDNPNRAEVTLTASYYDFAHHHVTSKVTEFKKIVEDTLEEPFIDTNQFVEELDKSLCKVIPFNQQEGF